MNKKRYLRFLPAVVIAMAAMAGITSGWQQLPELKITRLSPAVISLVGEEEFYIGRDLITPDNIAQRVKEILKDWPPDEQVVYIKASRWLKYGTVVSVIDIVREAGFDRIGLVAEREKPTADETKSPATVNNPIPPTRKGFKQSQASVIAHSEALIVVDLKLSTAGKMFINLNSKPMTLSKLTAYLKKVLAGREDKTVFVRAPKRMLYGDVVEVIDALKGAGAQPIGLQTQYLE